MRALLATCIVASAILLHGGGAAAQTHAQFERIDLLARYTVESAVCPKLGFEVKADGKVFSRALAAEAHAGGLAPAVAERMYGEAVQRRSRTFEMDLDQLSAQANESNNFSGLKALFAGQGELCVRAARDPLFSQIVKAPPGFDLDKAATAAADELLARGGLASWQTPQIQARGDILMLAGACRSHFGAARSDALFTQYSATESARERAYYSEAFQLGLSDTDLDLDATQCEGSLRNLRAKAGE
jgi:hypothetical protein